MGEEKLPISQVRLLSSDKIGIQRVKKINSSDLTGAAQKARSVKTPRAFLRAASAIFRRKKWERMCANPTAFVRFCSLRV